MDESEITGPSREKIARAERLRAKKGRGATLTRGEAGFLGAMGALDEANQERREARREGRIDAYEREHRTRSWMAGDETREPALSDETEREAERIRAKQARGETLTREEAGVLGGAARAEEGGRH